MSKAQDALDGLIEKLGQKVHRNPMPFVLFLHFSAGAPAEAFRNVFQLFHDMIHYYVPEGVDEYPDDPESINYMHYDCSKLFVEDADTPFFADRPFANKLVNLADSFKHGAQQRRIYIFEGLPGSGKSTFLNNLLTRFEEYTRIPDGAIYETYWRLDVEQLGANPEEDIGAFVHHPLQTRHTHGKHGTDRISGDMARLLRMGKYLDVPCPSHDHPILQVPKAYRRELLDQLIPDGDFKDRLFSRHEYEWVFDDEPCAICSSIYQALLDRLESPAGIFDMLHARRYFFNRMLGDGISVYNPGDPVHREPITNPMLQAYLNYLFRDSTLVEHVYSPLAKTNNGVFAIMDIKGHNKERLMDLHGIISDGIHKVGNVEERVLSFFIGIMNPEDEKAIGEMQSFEDRAVRINFHYVLDYKTEVEIYRHRFGRDIDAKFLPRVLDNFARVIISTRLLPRSEHMEEWIEDTGRYCRYCDENLLLLKMDIYGGRIPSWLSEDDRKGFNRRRRRAIVGEADKEGARGVSGRRSIQIFNEFYSKYVQRDLLISMDMVRGYFQQEAERLGLEIPEGFLDSLVKLYDYETLQEVKEALYHYNEERIAKDIQNYLFAINYEHDTTETCDFTGDVLEINEKFLSGLETRLLGSKATDEDREEFRNDTQRTYVTKTLAQEMRVEGKSIIETKLYLDLYALYTRSLKENALDPFLDNDNFRQAIKDFGSDEFKAHDQAIQDDVGFLIQNLCDKFGYTREGAKQVCVNVIDKDLARNDDE